LTLPLDLASHNTSGTRPSTTRQPRGSVEQVSALGNRTVDEMYALYHRYYDSTSLQLFQSDLKEKDFVVVLKDEASSVVGFSSLALVDSEIDGQRIRAIYSGDTIIDRAYWGTQALSFTWIRFAGIVKAEVLDCPLYWFLIVKGHRTYRYLSAFSLEFYPHWQVTTPAWAQSLMAGLARRRFHDAYDAERGVLSFPQSRGHLRPRWAAVEPEEARRPDVAFFLNSNPGYVRGDELVCLTELSCANLRPLARRLFGQGLRQEGLGQEGLRQEGLRQQDLREQDLRQQGLRQQGLRQ
jgi:hypothetical protein